MDKDVMDKVRRFQESKEFHTVRWNNHLIWPFIHIHVATSLKTSQKKTFKFLAKFNFALKGFIALTKLLFKPSKAEVFLLSSGHFKEKRNNIVIDKYLNVFITYLRHTKKAFLVADFTKDLNEPKEINYSKESIGLQRVIVFLSIIWRIQYKLNKSVWTDEYIKINESLDNTNISYRLSLKEEWRLFYLFKQANFFKWFLKRAQVKKAIVVCFYDIKSMALVKACNDLKIPILDVQHGVQGKGHSSYNLTDYNLIKTSKLYPSHFWVWTDKEKEFLSKTFPKENIIVGGNPSLKTINTDIEKEYILISDQGLYDSIPTILSEAIKAYTGAYKFLYRFHPQNQDFVDKIKQEILESDYADKVVFDDGLYLLSEALLKTKVHITSFSSVSINAYAYGIRTVFLDAKAKFIFEDLISLAYLKYVNNSAELLNTIHKFSQLTNTKPQHSLDAFSKVKIFIDD